MRNGGHRRALTRETLLALLVLALTFLNYGHVAVSAAGDLRITPDSWCGSPLAPNPANHAPCHACRIGQGADLPPSSACVEPVAFVVHAVAYAAPLVLAALPVGARAAQPRGPPALV